MVSKDRHLHIYVTQETRWVNDPRVHELITEQLWTGKIPPAGPKDLINYQHHFNLHGKGWETNWFKDQKFLSRSGSKWNSQKNKNQQESPFHRIRSYPYQVSRLPLQRSSHLLSSQNSKGIRIPFEFCWLMSMGWHWQFLDHWVSSPNPIG